MNRLKKAKKIISMTAMAILLLLIFVTAQASRQNQKRFKEQILENFSHRADHLAALMSYIMFERQQDGEDIESSVELMSYFQGRDLGMSPQYGLITIKENIQDLLKRTLYNTTYQDSPVYSRIAVILDGGMPLAVTPSTNDSPPDWGRYRYSLDKKGRMTTEWENGSPRLVISKPFFYKGKYEAQIVLWIIPSDTLARIRTTHKNFPWDQVFITTRNGQKVVSPFENEKQASKIFQIMEDIKGPEILSDESWNERLLVVKSNVPDTPLSLFLVAPEEKFLGSVKFDETWTLLVLFSMALFIAWTWISDAREERRKALSRLKESERNSERSDKRLSFYIPRISLCKKENAQLLSKIKLLKTSLDAARDPIICFRGNQVLHENMASKSIFSSPANNVDRTKALSDASLKLKLRAGQETQTFCTTRQSVDISEGVKATIVVLRDNSSILRLKKRLRKERINRRSSLQAFRIRTESSPPPSLWDMLDQGKFSKLAEMLGNDGDVLNGVIRDFIKSLPVMQKSLRQAIKDEDLEGIGSRSSNLREALFFIGRPSLVKICSSIEEESLAGNIDRITQLEKDLSSSLEELVSALQRKEWRELNGHSFNSRRRPHNQEDTV